MAEKAKREGDFITVTLPSDVVEKFLRNPTASLWSYHELFEIQIDNMLSDEED